MRTNIIENLKKIEINISPKDLTHEQNQFFSIRFDSSHDKSIYDLSNDDMIESILNIYITFLKNDPEFNAMLKEKFGDTSDKLNAFKNNIKKTYKLDKYDYNILNYIYPSKNDNLLFYNINQTFNKYLSNGYQFIAKMDYRIDKIAKNLIGFLNLDLTNFDGFFSFFLTFICEYIDKIPDEYKKEILDNQIPDEKCRELLIVDYDDKKYTPIDMIMLQNAAKSIYKKEINHVIKMQTTFRNFVDYIFNNNMEAYLKPYSISERFFVFSNTNTIIDNISKAYSVDYPLHYSFTSDEFDTNILSEIVKKPNSNPLTDENFLLKEIAKKDSDSEIFSSSCSFTTTNVYTYFYITLYHLTLTNNIFIKKCLNCHKYFKTSKSNISYCDTNYKDGITCKQLGAKMSQKRKEQNEPVYGKYRSIYAKKSMMVKRNPDIESYKTNYENWKKEAKEFLNCIKNGTKTYDEFDKWLDQNS